MRASTHCWMEYSNHLDKDKTLKVIPPTGDRERLFREAHQGAFSGHLRESKIHSQLSRHYWWPRMRKTITDWCRACLTCATRSPGLPIRPPLTPIPVNGPFDRVGVDVLQLSKTRQGNCYAIVFMDYLTKWPEVYATPDQTAPTIARLLVEEIISRHGVPNQLLSDRGPSFLSKLLLNVCEVMGIQKVNTSACHPQCDGLVERFNRICWQSRWYQESVSGMRNFPTYSLPRPTVSNRDCPVLDT